MNPRDVPIPTLMRDLPLDPRGYPIGKFVWHDSEGRPHFTINDEGIRQHHIRDDLCPICGKKLLRFRWFVGGPASAYHEHGCYIDPPMHDECAHYALKVCPYLAAPSYGKRLDAKLVAEADQHHTFVDPSMVANRPDFMVAVCARKTLWTTKGELVRYVRPSHPYVKVEHWRHGQEIPVDPEAVDAALARALAQVAG